MAKAAETISGGNRKSTSTTETDKSKPEVQVKKGGALELFGKLKVTRGPRGSSWTAKFDELEVDDYLIFTSDGKPKGKPDDGKPESEKGDGWLTQVSAAVVSYNNRHRQKDGYGVVVRKLDDKNQYAVLKLKDKDLPARRVGNK